jgi:hypothetical protein
MDWVKNDLKGLEESISTCNWYNINIKKNYLYNYLFIL